MNVRTISYVSAKLQNDLLVHIKIIRYVDPYGFESFCYYGNALSSSPDIHAIFRKLYRGQLLLGDKSGPWFYFFYMILHEYSVHIFSW